MKRAGVFAAGVALAASTMIATPSFGVTHKDPCATLQNQLNTLEVRLARQGLDTRQGGKTFGKILVLKQTAKQLHCHVA
ncbi:MAG: hypothetical protein JO148_01240 [Acidimicrobiia bacterium]|nr:hypothetical protein [Acidimicrobiia bacterium]